MTSYPEQLQRLRDLCSPAIEPGLERMQALLDELGQPQQQLKKVIHVGGTNGKGSVCALLEAMLAATGRRVGLYTSPHLHDFRERFRLDRKVIEKEAITPLLEEVNAALSRLRAQNGPLPTEFEASTALAFLYYARTAPDWLILEVGLGGRYDATNLVQAPLAVLTNIGRDHMDYLGDTIAEIAFEKAGIIKPGATVFTAAEGEAWQIFSAEARLQGAKLVTLGEDLCLELLEHNTSGQLLNIHTPRRSYLDLRLGLLGAHQGVNATLAVACAEEAGLSESAIRAGLLTARHPARLEILQQQPLVLLDGAHNEHGIQALSQALQEYWPGQRILALLGMLADKERQAALRHLTPLLAGAVISRPPLLHRSGDWARLAEFCAADGLIVPRENIIEDIPAACARALALLPDYDMLLVCGSLYLVAEARAALLPEVQA